MGKLNFGALVVFLIRDCHQLRQVVGNIAGVLLPVSEHTLERVNP